MAKVAENKVFVPNMEVKNKKPINTDSVEAFTPETDRQVRGIFKNLEFPGQSAKITMRLYKGQKVFNELMFDGREYTIPLSIAKAINKYTTYNVHKYGIEEKTGEQRKDIGQTVQRYQFIPTDYL